MPGFGMNYNPPYYHDLFESYGFYAYFKPKSPTISTSPSVSPSGSGISPAAYVKRSIVFDRSRSRRPIVISTILLKLYNEAWVFHENFTPMDKKVLQGMFAQAKSFLVEDMIWYAYHQGEPAGFLVVFPDINNVIRHFNGHLGWFNKLHFFFMVRSRRF